MTLPNAGYAPWIIQGEDGIVVSQTGVRVVISGAGVVSPVASGSFQRNPSFVSTASVVPVPFWSAPFVLSRAADIFFEHLAIAFMTNTVGAGTNMGVVYTCDIDGIPLPDVGFDQTSLTAPTFLQTRGTSVALQTMAPALAAGAHVFNLFIQSLDPGCTVSTGPGEASLHISEV